MNTETSIVVQNITKIYKLFDNPIDRLKESFHPFKKKYHRDFYALRDVSFDVKKGEVVGIVGKNGCGKSTLLQIITGVLTQSSGEVTVTGNVSALLELSAGFNPELSGIDNIYFKSSILGFSKEQTEAKIDDILSFADIGEFIYQPIKTYSSGMYGRLGFAVAINVDPDILIIDEALSTGDFRFQQKCLRKIREFQEIGKTILFVSHNTGSVVEFCSRAIWLMDGKVHDTGTPNDICKQYISFMAYGETSSSVESDEVREVASSAGNHDDDGKFGGIKWQPLKDISFFGTGKATIDKISLCLKNDKSMVTMFEGGERVIFYIGITVHETITQPIVGFHLSDANGVNLLGMNTCVLNRDLGVFEAGETKIVEFEFDFPALKVGSYAFSPAIAEGDQVENVQHHWVHDAYLLEIASADPSHKLGHFFVIKENVDIRVS